jgi:hypothetical protein
LDRLSLSSLTSTPAPVLLFSTGAALPAVALPAAAAFSSSSSSSSAVAASTTIAATVAVFCDQYVRHTLLLVVLTKAYVESSAERRRVGERIEWREGAE